MAVDPQPQYLPPTDTKHTSHADLYMTYVLIEVLSFVPRHCMTTRFASTVRWIVIAVRLASRGWYKDMAMAIQ